MPHTQQLTRLGFCTELLVIKFVPNFRTVITKKIGIHKQNLAVDGNLENV